jgi:hypothetical protein
MRYIRKIDGREHTVLMMQVENETGILGTPRDRCPLSEERFAQQVPVELMQYLKAHADSLIPDLLHIWQAAGRRATGTWAEVFGVGADEVFMAWHVAQYVDAVAAAGKSEYSIPIYANAWLVNYDGQKPGGYPSGGPVARMMDVWRAAALHIDFLAPDIYRNDFRAVCREYTQSGNPLMIPEAHNDERAAANVFYAVAQHDAICFSPFAIDSVVEPHPLTASYRLLAGMMPVITKHQGTGRMVGVLHDGEYACGYELGGYRLNVQFQKPLEKGKVPAAGLIIATADDEYIVAGAGFTVRFAPKPSGLPNVEILTLDEGLFEKGKWIPGRRLNGDESFNGTELRLGEEPSVQIAKVYSYA